MKLRVHQAQASLGMRSPGAFSIIELLVTMAVLTMIIGLLMQLLNGTTAVTSGSTAHMDADSQARIVFDRLADDLAAMPKRNDIDFVFSKENGGQQGLNDQLYFYSGVPGFFSAATSSTSQSPTSLIGYRIDSVVNYQLQRMAKGMPWSGSPNSVVYLTLSGAPHSFAPDQQSTLEGSFGSSAWQAIVTGSDGDYSFFGQGIFRLEFCYYLKDGTYSNKPVISSSQFANNLTASAAPASSNDSTGGYSTGSRWYDSTGKRGYICVSASPGAAIWVPLGLDDVSSLVVVLAVLDLPSRKKASDLKGAMEIFPDPSDADLAANPPRLMAATWQSIADAPDFASKAGIPQSVAAKVRIYQRYFSISPQ